ncbi:MAG: hypothetical protein IJ087_12590 [Eggerthellaceae bacterium]|nr:hypothetical protein [Eggerthellaceae bacterium]
MWRWFCIVCGTDLGPVVGRHLAKCPRCGCRSAVARKVMDELPGLDG